MDKTIYMKKIIKAKNMVTEKTDSRHLWSWGLTFRMNWRWNTFLLSDMIQQFLALWDILRMSAEANCEWK